MKNKKKNRLLVLVFILIIQLGVKITYIPRIPIVDAMEVQPFADVIEWRLQEINGIWYRRLYNVTKRVWVGDWVPL